MKMRSMTTPVSPSRFERRGYSTCSGSRYCTDEAGRLRGGGGAGGAVRAARAVARPATGAGSGGAGSGGGGATNGAGAGLGAAVIMRGSGAIARRTVGVGGGGGGAIFGGVAGASRLTKIGATSATASRTSRTCSKRPDRGDVRRHDRADHGTSLQRCQAIVIGAGRQPEVPPGQGRHVVKRGLHAATLASMRTIRITFGLHL